MSFSAKRILVSLSLGVVVAGIGVAGLSAPAFATACPTSNPVLQSDITNGADYTVCNFDDVSFAGLTGDSINFSITHLTNTNFSGATFSNSDFANASGGGEDFRETRQGQTS